MVLVSMVPEICDKSQTPYEIRKGSISNNGLTFGIQNLRRLRLSKIQKLNFYFEHPYRDC